MSHVELINPPANGRMDSDLARMDAFSSSALMALVRPRVLFTAKRAHNLPSRWRSLFKSEHHLPS
jgi:hypothetical protein